MKARLDVLGILGAVIVTFIGGFFLGKASSKALAPWRAKRFVTSLMKMHVEDRAAAVERFRTVDPEAFLFLSFGTEGVRFTL